MFNLFNNVYLSSRLHYETRSSRLILDKQLVNIYDVNEVGIREGVANSVHEYIDQNHGGDINKFFEFLITKSIPGRSREDFKIYLCPRQMISFLAIWHKNVFTKGNIDGFHWLTKLFIENFKITYMIYNKRTFDEAKEFIDKWNELVEDGKTLTDEYKAADKYRCNKKIREYLCKNISIEFLLVLKSFGKPVNTEELNERIKRLVYAMFNRGNYQETRSKLIHCLPRINLYRKDLHFDPCDVTSYYQLLGDAEVGELIDNVSLPRDVYENHDKMVSLFNTSDKLVKHDTNGKTNIGYRIFIENGINYNSLVKSIETTKVNFVFHEQGEHWQKFNHAMLGLFVDKINGKHIDGIEHLTEGVDNAIFW